ncbi:MULTISPECIES: STAS domain-containing protein [Fervidobacterium]|uniref:Anti-sigma factor antagonist n=2 Tax=Fervidobacterium TaxID=2422 RepID=A0AAI8CJ14_FERIS|nr:MULTISPECIES: STAS domain-containing protein [Fervidobacterium]AMW32354.1 STAS domain-containing protein [Fervidobacterium islandicum]QAV32297.1 anti-sigma factor antagonist [Fervidobacterium changbaicum]QAV34061.1 anti-sigma factor antagonist [Fervidobacterium changbaicum]
MYTYTEHGKAVVIKIGGSIDIQNAQSFKDWVISEFLENGKKYVILDMTHATNIDSYGLGILVGIYKRLVLQDGYLKIVAPNKNIRTLFEVTGLDRIIRIYETVSNAIKDE